MTINDEMLILVNQLANAGKKPTVAMIKAKLSKKVPLPVIISTLKVWQHDPNFITTTDEKHEITEKENTAVEIDTFKQNLNSELAQMKQDIIELKQQVKQLTEQQKG